MSQKTLTRLFLVLSFELLGMNKQGTCQVKSVPQTVIDNFVTRFPGANSVEWKNKLTDYQVFFLAGNSKCEAKFSLDGKWISTERQIKNDSIPEKIRDYFRLSKYNDWNIQSVYILEFPDQDVQYHIVAAKDDLPHKLFFFTKTGQLLNNNILL